MYSVSNLSNESRDFVSMIPKLSKANKDVVSFALAKVISNSLSLPSSPVEHSGDYYIDNNYFKVLDIVNFINELVVVDVERVLELTKNLWATRYNVLYTNRKLFKLQTTQPTLTYFGIVGKLSQNEMDFIAANEIDIIVIYNGFFQMFSELNTLETQETLECA